MSIPVGAQPPDPQAAARDEARTVALEGIQLFEESRFADALEKLRAAEAKFHAPTHLLYIARSYQGLGQLLEAHDAYVSVLSEAIPNYAPEAFHKARAQAEQEEAQLRGRIATVRVEVSGATGPATVTVDGNAIAEARLAYPIAVATGEHRVAVQSGDGRDEETVSAAIGQTTAVKLEIVAPKVGGGGGGNGGSGPPDEGGGFPIAAGVAFGIGGAALIAGAITGGITLAQASDIKDQCPEDQCAQPGRSAEETAALEADSDDAKVIGNASTALFVIGGVGVAAGVVIVIASGGGDEEAARSTSWRVGVTPTGAAFTGSF